MFGKDNIKYSMLTSVEEQKVSGGTFLVTHIICSIQ